MAKLSSLPDRLLRLSISIFDPQLTYAFIAIAIGISHVGCIGDDIIFDEVDPIVRIMNTIDTIELGTTYTFEFTYFNNTGEEERVTGAQWSSDNPTTISIDNQGMASALELGSANISVTLTDPNGIEVMDAHTIIVGNSTVSNDDGRTGMLRTTSSYKLEGSFSMEKMDNNLILSFSEDYEASSNLPGLFIYLTNNPNTVNNAFEIGAVEVFKGEHSYTIEGVDLNDYSHVLYFCKPFVVKVGDGAFDN